MIDRDELQGVRDARDEVVLSDRHHHVLPDSRRRGAAQDLLGPHPHGRVHHGAVDRHRPSVPPARENTLGPVDLGRRG